jgi:hypothetical protein
VRGLMGMGGDQLLPRVVEGLDSETEPGKHIAAALRDSEGTLHGRHRSGSRCERTCSAFSTRA